MLVPITVSEVMSEPVETIEPGASVREAATRLYTRSIGSVVVVEDGDPVGIVTDCDMTRLVSGDRDPTETAVEQIMAAPVITIEPDNSLETAAERMRNHKVKRLPVVAEGELDGIVTTTDLTNFLPHIVRLGREQEPDETRERHTVRVDTAYEKEDWEFEYFGAEERIDVGDVVNFSKVLDERDVEAFAEASGDTNRLHLEDDYAETTRFGERIAHGTLVCGVISAALARLPGLIIYLSQDTSYLGPAPIGDRVIAECEVVEDIGNRRFRLSTVVSTESGDRVIDGEAVVISDPIPDGD